MCGCFIEVFAICYYDVVFGCCVLRFVVWGRACGCIRFCLMFICVLTGVCLIVVDGIVVLVVLLIYCLMIGWFVGCCGLEFVVC